MNRSYTVVGQLVVGRPLGRRLGPLVQHCFTQGDKTEVDQH